MLSSSSEPVLSAHPLQVELSPLVSAAELGSALLLTCRASGCLHPPTLTWRRTDRDRTFLQRTQQQDGLSLLQLQDLDLEDQGGYSCEAECDSVVRTGSTQVHVLCESLKSGVHYVINNHHHLNAVAQRGQHAVTMKMKKYHHQNNQTVTLIS